MFYHEDGIPDEDAFVAYLAQMKDGDTVKIPRGMKPHDASMCVGAAEPKTHICFKVERGLVLASEDPYVTLLLRSPPGAELDVPVGARVYFKAALHKVRKKSKNSFKMVGGKIVVDL